MRVLVTKKGDELYGKMVEVGSYANSSWCIPIPKPVRTAWQWHELYEYIKIRKHRKLFEVWDNKSIRFYSDHVKLILDSIETKYGMLLHKCKERMKVSK